MELYDKDFYTVANESEIAGAMKEYVYEIIPQNTEDCYTEGSVTVRTEDGKYYDVVVKVEMWGAKQDVGDKLYTIEEVGDVTYTEISYEDLAKRFNSNVTDKIKHFSKEIETLKSKLITL